MVVFVIFRDGILIYRRVYILGDCCIFKSIYGFVGFFRGRFKRIFFGLLINCG